MKKFMKHFIVGAFLLLFLVASSILFYTINQKRHLNSCIEKEDENHLVYANNLKEAANRIQIGMRREDVEKILKVPPNYFFFDESKNTVNWSWTTSTQISCISKRLKIMPEKGYYTLSIVFDNDGQVINKYDGIN